MMKRRWRIRDSVEIEVTAPNIEEFLNLCAALHIEFWNVRKHSSVEAVMFLRKGGLRLLQKYQAKECFEIAVLCRSGAGFLLGRLKHRYALILGILLFLFLMWWNSLHIWQIEVYGNENVSTQEILSVLDELGVHIGSMGVGINSERLAIKVKREIPELSWFAINISGARAEVLVRERTPIPKLFDYDAPTMVIAGKSGVIEEIITLEGVRALSKGNTVLKGDIIVSGAAETIAGDVRGTHATAKVTGRTWYEFTAQIPDTTVYKRPTRRRKTFYSVNIAGKRINFYLNSGIKWPCYDKIIMDKSVVLFNSLLPISFEKQVFTEYETEAITMSDEAAKDILTGYLNEKLRCTIGIGSIEKQEFEFIKENGCCKMIMTAECLEDIGQERPFTDEELLLLQSASHDAETEN